MNTYTITSTEPLDLLDLLDAVGLILEPDRTHRPSRDTLMFHVRSGKMADVRHSRLGLTIMDSTET